MTEALNQLISALQEELKQYGEMLALLDDQQEFVMRRVVEDLVLSVSAVQKQGLVMQKCRQQRELLQQKTARAMGLPEKATFSEMIPGVPSDYRPLLEALVHENNELLFRIQQRARQNHLLLSRSLELMQRFLNSLFASGDGTVYTDRGNVFSRPTSAPTLYEAVG